MLIIQGEWFDVYDYEAFTIISLIAAFCGLSFLLAIIITSKLSNFILHQFGGLHKLWDAPLCKLKGYSDFFICQLSKTGF